MPVGYWSTIPGLESMKTSLEKQGIPAAFSFYAGEHLCNHILYSSLQIAAKGNASHKSGFIHIPVLPEQVIQQHPASACLPLAESRRAPGIVVNHVIEAAGNG